MKKLNKFFIALMSAGLLASCSSDNLDGPKTPNKDGVGEGVFMSLDIELPTSSGTRSATEADGTSDANPDTEIGKDYENQINTVFIVLARTSDNGYIASGTVANNKLTKINDGSCSAIVKIQKSDIATYYEKDGFNPDINVFVFCNPINSFIENVSECTFGAQWKDLICSETIDAISTANSFLMSNAKIAKRTLPATIDDWDNYKTEATAFQLSDWNAQGSSNQVDNSVGAVEVIRTAARFDFKDGSSTTTPANTYNVIYGINSDGTQGAAFINVELQKMALTNMAKQYYYLHRVSVNGKNENSLLCGNETKTNYIVGPYADKTLNDIQNDFSTYYNYPLFKKTDDGTFVIDNTDVSSDRWATSLITSVLGQSEDNYAGDYKIWRYCTENVIPAETSNQEYGRSTIIVFKGRIIATEDALNASQEAYPWVKEVAECLNNKDNMLTGNPSTDPIIYQFAGSLYKTWPGVRNAVIRDAVKLNETEGKIESINRNNALYVAVYGAGGMGTFTYNGKEYTDNVDEAEETPNKAWDAWNKAGKPNNGVLLKTMRNTVTGAGFTIYQSSTDKKGDKEEKGYYCYYYYANYHNDNGRPGVMGPMEFAVVRNNVYKLSVTEINKLGHPRISDNDPDKPTPDTPDESDNIYLSVKCKVLPWTVRINNIKF